MDLSNNSFGNIEMTRRKIFFISRAVYPSMINGDNKLSYDYWCSVAAYKAGPIGYGTLEIMNSNISEPSIV